MAITTLAGVQSNLTLPVTCWFGSVTTEGTGTYTSLFRAPAGPSSGRVGGATGATAPAYTAGSGYTCSNATTGAIFCPAPASGNKYLASLDYSNLAANNALILYDRLWACSGFVTNSPGTANITTPGTIPTGRDANGATLGHGVEIWGEIYTAPGATGATWTVSYTNQDGTAGRTATYTHPANAETAMQLVPFDLQAGDTGVRSVQSFTHDISSGTAGDVGITLLRPITEVNIPVAAVRSHFDCIQLGFPRLYDGTCLAGLIRCGTTSSSTIMLTLVYADG